MSAALASLRSVHRLRLPPMPDITHIIEQRSNCWMRAWVDQDRATLEDSLAPDYALIVSALPDRRMERDLWLATCERYVATSFHYRDVQVRNLGNGMAIMSAIAEQQASLSGVDRSGSLFVTDIWRLEPDGQWRRGPPHSPHP